MRDYYMPETPITDAVVVTNADHIRAMTDEELAYLIRRGVCELIGATQDHCETNTCVDCVLDWLKQPAE